MRINILVVDDKEENRYALKSLLEEYKDDIAVYLASGGEEALSMVLAESIDVIILDIQMPGMDGFEVAKFIKGSPKTKDIPIIFLTAAFKEDEFRTRGFEVGAVDYLTKPVEDYQLINKVNLYADLYRQRMMLKAINSNLEEKIKEGVEELRKKDKLLIQQSKMAAMGEMIAIISHQWKQPLNTLGLIPMSLQSAYEMNRIDEAFIAKLSDKVTKQVRYMAQTIDDFSTFLKPDKTKQSFSVISAIEKTLAILKSQLYFSDVEVVINGDDVELSSYENELQQVILNIVNNAKDALVEHNPGQRKVTIDIKRDAFVLMISISDNAGGIPEEIINRVFESYFTTKGSEGTGVGLYMSKMIVEESLMGRIKVHNDEDGAVFTIELPL